MKKAITLFLIIFTFAIALSNKNVDAATEGIGVVKTNGSNLNIRSSASSNSTVIGKLSNGSYVTILNDTNSFYYIQFNGNNKGYVSKSYVTYQSATYKYTNATSLNVRKGPSTSYAIIATLPNNTKVSLIEKRTSFSKILFNSSTVGYVSNSYLKNYANYSLKTSNFKQFDSRWANVKIGTSTMKAIGCATTSLAITESYRLNQTITPDVMKQRLSYTAGGAVYWPTNYTLDYSSNYLLKIYTLLSEGKPVIFHGKNTKSSHFVVVNGFYGGSLSAANFTISDPGSSFRTNLQEYLNTYSTYQKLVYYK